jgi:hypothetical protein
MKNLIFLFILFFCLKTKAQNYTSFQLKGDTLYLEYYDAYGFMKDTSDQKSFSRYKDSIWRLYNEIELEKDAIIEQYRELRMTLPTYEELYEILDKSWNKNKKAEEISRLQEYTQYLLNEKEKRFDYLIQEQRTYAEKVNIALNRLVKKAIKPNTINDVEISVLITKVFIDEEIWEFEFEGIVKRKYYNLVLVKKPYLFIKEILQFKNGVEIYLRYY